MQIRKSDGGEAKNMAHAKYRCRHYIAFAPKYRRKETYRPKRDRGESLRTLYEQKNVGIPEAEACPDHIHMPVSIRPVIPPVYCWS